MKPTHPFLRILLIVTLLAIAGWLAWQPVQQPTSPPPAHVAASSPPNTPAAPVEPTASVPALQPAPAAVRPLAPLPPPVAPPSGPAALTPDSENWLAANWPGSTTLQRVDRPSGKGPFRRVTVIQPRSLPYPVRIEEAVTSENGREIVRVHKV